MEESKQPVGRQPVSNQRPKGNLAQFANEPQYAKKATNPGFQTAPNTSQAKPGNAQRLQQQMASSGQAGGPKIASYKARF